MGKSLKEILKEGPVFEEEILRKAEEGKLVFFIGAGVSRLMGVQGWDGFSEFLIRKAFPEYKEYSTILRDIKDSKERITIAYKKFEQDNKLDEFYRLFGEGMKPNKNIFNSKENIYEILNRFNATFLTTNADDLFEDVLGNAVCHEECNSLIIRNELLRRQNHLFYLHGHYKKDINVHENNLVFTAPQYVAKYNNPVFEEFLTAIFQEDNVIIFIGYGLNEFELIDYIVTKANYSTDYRPKVYVLYGLCEDEEILYRAKKAYFEALNIKLIPYDMSKKGYDSLIDVLNSLYKDYRKRVIVPTVDIIRESIANYNPNNYAVITRYLKDEDLAHTTEVQITQEIQKRGSFIWVENFYKDGLFSSVQMDKKIEYKGWPLLELFSDWVKSDEEYAQTAAVEFLDSITKQQRRQLKEQYTYINKHIIEIVLSLDKKHIKARYIDLMCEVAGNNNLFYHEVREIENLKRILQWNTKYIRKLLDSLFRKVDFNDFHDGMSYVIEKFFKKLNSEIDGERIAIFMLTYFVNLVKKAIVREYVLFIHIRALDNIYKNHQTYWKLAMTEIQYCFSRLRSRKQYEVLRILFKDDNEACWKLALYLARKYNQNIVELIVENKEVLNSYTCYHEYYLLLKHHAKNKFLSGGSKSNLCGLICESEFGIGEYIEKDPEYYNALILSKRFLLLQYLMCDEAKEKIAYFKEKKIEAYNSDEIAEQCDYVHSIKWENEIKLSVETFQDVTHEQWADKFAEICSVVNEDFVLSDCARQFVQIVLERSEEEIDVIIPTLKSLPKQMLRDVIQALYAKRDSLTSYTVLINTCLDLLEVLSCDILEDKLLVKTIFSLLSNIEIKNEKELFRMLEVINPWLKVSIGEDETFSGKNNFLSNLINYDDFAKFSVLINCYVSLKKNVGYEISDNEINKMIDLLEEGNPKNIYRYTLCYNYQNLKYIAQDRDKAFTVALLSGTAFSMHSLLLCVLNSHYVFEELVDAVKENYLFGLRDIPDECKDGVLTNRLYEFIIAACQYEYLSQEDMKTAYADSKFVDYFLHSISTWSKKENFVLEDWLIPCWNCIKENNNEIQDYTELLLHSIGDVVNPTERLLDLYLEALEYCSNSSSIYVDFTKMLDFIDVNVEKGILLSEGVIKGNDFIDKDELLMFAKKCVEVERKESVRILLNWLSDEGRISLVVKEEIAKLL